MAKKRKRRPRAVTTQNRPPSGNAGERSAARGEADARAPHGSGDGRSGTRGDTTQAERQRANPAQAERHSRKEEARHQREQIRKRMTRRRRTRQGGIALVAIVIVAVAAYMISQSGKANPPVSPKALPGLNSGPPPWPAELTHLHDRLLALDMPPQAVEGQGLHSDQHLSIYVDGKPVEIPQGIGIPPGYKGDPGTTDTDFISILHTHDTTGTVHVEAPSSHSYTLGEFFDVWGVRFTPTCIGSLCETNDKQIRVYVNGKLETGDPTRIGFSLEPFSQMIVLTYGTKAELPNPIPAQIPGA